jgi:hypothetical protein
MAKSVFAAGIAAAFAVLLLTPVVVAAKGFGPQAPLAFGAHPIAHGAFSKSIGPYRSRAFAPNRFSNRLGGYSAGYGYGLPDAYFDDIEPVVVTFPPLRIDPVIPAPPPLTCSRSRETLTVPAESGGTREITITRC